MEKWHNEIADSIVAKLDECTSISKLITYLYNVTVLCSKLKTIRNVTLKGINNTVNANQMGLTEEEKNKVNELTEFMANIINETDGVIKGGKE